MRTCHSHAEGVLVGPGIWRMGLGWDGMGWDGMATASFAPQQRMGARGERGCSLTPSCVVRHAFILLSVVAPMARPL